MMYEKIIGLKLKEAKKILDGEKVFIKLTKPPRDEEELSRDSRIVRVKINEKNEIELILCNTPS